MTDAKAEATSKIVEKIEGQLKGVQESFRLPDLSAAYADLAKQMGREGWHYRDIPKCSQEVWKTLLDVIGEENLAALAVSHGTGPQGPWSRGQVLISPAGIDRLKEHAAARRIAELTKPVSP